MTDIADIGFKADTSQLEKAADKLEDLKPAAEKAEKASKRVADATGRMRDEFGRFLPGAQKTQSRLRKLASGAGLTSKAFGTLTKGFKSLTSGVTGFISGAVAAFSFATLISSANNLSGSIAELATLLPPASSRLLEMRNAARAMADEFGTNAAFQLKAFYGAVSAGATSTKDAMNVVDTANKLAIGGMTDVSTGVRVITGAMASYRDEGLTAVEVSDALFAGMKAGQTTVDELANSIGDITPLGKALGISFEELVSATAALTLNNMSTAKSTTSLKAIFAGIAKPTSEASKLAKKLGIDFSVAGFKSKGLSKFLSEVVEKTGGSADQLSILFGSIEALGGALVYAGEGGKQFNEILTNAKAEAGESATAYATVANSLTFRWNKLLAEMGNIAADFGLTLLGVLVPIGEGFRDLLTGVSPLIPVFKALSVVLIGLAASQMPALITATALYVKGISLAGVATGVFTAAVNVARLAVIALGGPIGVLFAIIGSVAAGMLLFGDNAKVAERATYDAEAATRALNTQLNLFRSTEAPAAGQAALNIASANVTLANSAYEAAKAELAKRRALVESARAGASESMGGQTAFFTRLAAEKSALDDLTKAENDLKTAQNERLTTVDLIGEKLKSGFNQLISDNEQTKISNAGVATSFEDIATPVKKIGTEAQIAKQSVTELQALSEGFSSLSEPFNQAQSAFDILKTNLDNGIITNDEYANSLSRIEQAFLKTGGSADQWSKVVGKNSSKIAKDLEGLKNNTISSLSGEIANLAVDGKANFADLARGVIKSLIKIAVQAMITKALTGGLFGSGGGFGGGAGSGNIPGFETSALYADGAAFNNCAEFFANGASFTNSVVDKPTAFAFAKGAALGVMGEAGPEAIMPLQRGSDGSLGVQMYGGDQGSNRSVNNSVEVNNEYRIEGAISEETIIAQIEQSGEVTKEAVKNKIVEWLQTQNTDGVLI